ncbi:MAG: hypothetical protein M3Q69_13210 [Acidobacteriota bacterium]|nr:hypothetical protein [Acidobacteriota bacterium]
MGFLLTWRDLSILFRTLGLLLVAFLLSRYVSSGWRSLTLSPQGLIVRDRLRRERLVAYASVRRISYYPKTMFRVLCDSGDSIGFDPNTAGVEEFIRELFALVTTYREIELAGSAERITGSSNGEAITQNRRM